MNRSDIGDGGEYLARNPGWHVEESAWKVAHVSRMLERHHLRPDTVCDVGCGAGEVLRLLQRRLGEEAELWGYDVAPRAIELAAPRANARLHFRLGDPPPVADEPRFDVVLLLDMVEHVEDCFGFLRRLHGLGRHTVVHLPLDLSVQTVLRPGGLPYVRRTYGHVHYFTRELALDQLRETGYEIVDSAFTARAVDQAASGARRRLMRWPRRLLGAVRPGLAARVLGGWGLLVLAA